MFADAPQSPRALPLLDTASMAESTRLALLTADAALAMHSAPDDTMAPGPPVVHMVRDAAIAEAIFASETVRRSGPGPAELRAAGILPEAYPVADFESFLAVLAP